MINLISSLRTRSRAIATALLVVLMATWLSVLCPDCVVQAAETPAPASHCHSDSAPAPEPAQHDCCPDLQAVPCAGGDCAELTPVTLSATDLPSPASAKLELLPSALSEHLIYPPRPFHAAAPARVVADVSCPLYLRHCVFLN